MAAGGIGVLLKGLCEQLALRSHDVHVVGCYAISEAITDCLNGVQVHRLPGRFGWAGLILDRVSLYRKISKIAKEEAIDIIEAPDFEAPSALLPRQSRVRLVRLHGSHVYFSHERNVSPSRSISMLEKVALRQSDAWISVSNYTAQETKSLFGLVKSIHIVNNAAHVPKEAPRKSDYAQRRKIVFFGTLAEKKGVFSLVKAWRIFLTSHPGWRLNVIGRDGVYEKRSVREQMDEILGDASDTVNFMGSIPNEDLLLRLAEFDFAILPSFSETFAIAPMEAMALGVPVIGSVLSSGPELINHGLDGWLADPRDHEQMADLLSEVADDPVNRERVGRAGRAKVEKYLSHGAFVDKNIKVYRKLLADEAGLA